MCPQHQGPTGSRRTEHGAVPSTYTPHSGSDTWPRSMRIVCMISHVSCIRIGPIWISIRPSPYVCEVSISGTVCSTASIDASPAARRVSSRPLSRPSVRDAQDAAARPCCPSFSLVTLVSFRSRDARTHTETASSRDFGSHFQLHHHACERRGSRPSLIPNSPICIRPSRVHRPATPTSAA